MKKHNPQTKSQHSVKAHNLHSGEQRSPRGDSIAKGENKTVDRFKMKKPITINDNIKPFERYPRDEYWFEAGIEEGKEQALEEVEKIIDEWANKNEGIMNYQVGIYNVNLKDIEELKAQIKKEMKE